METEERFYVFELVDIGDRRYLALSKNGFNTYGYLEKHEATDAVKKHGIAYKDYFIISSFSKGTFNK